MDAPGRPGPVRWLWYTFGGRLNPRNREWVVHDVTARSRWLRQVARTLAQAAIGGTLTILVLGFGWVTWVSVISGPMLALMYYGVFFERSPNMPLPAWIPVGYCRARGGRAGQAKDDPDWLARQRHGDHSEAIAHGHHRNTAATVRSQLSANRPTLRHQSGWTHCGTTGLTLVGPTVRGHGVAT